MNARSSSSIALVDEPLLDPVGEAARVEAVLQPAAAVVVDAHAEIMRVGGGGSPRGRARRLDSRRLAVGRRSVRSELAGGAAARRTRACASPAGVYGERTDEIAQRLDECAAGAEVLVVQGGINDIAQGP